ncbi:glycosyltransferase family 2 protein [Brevundimonas sp.]|uniref:glycosyltransferase family 2 protein n=1 Tax=Brevundimonas sp. TaxID=1871086 RepID=UPI0035B22428
MIARVSVLIPTYNRAALLTQALEACRWQTRRADEIIVVDDGSTDATAGVLAAWTGPGRIVLRQVNGGKAAALNRGLAAARGDAVLVLDDDDLLPPDALANHVAALDAAPAAGFSYGRYARFTGEGTPTATPTDVEPIDRRDPRRLHLRLIDHDFLPNPAWMARGSALAHVGGYDEALARSQDFDMILRLARAVPAAPIDAVVLWQRVHSSLRGRGAERAAAVHTTGLWAKYDAIMMAGLDRRWSDEDYQPLERPEGVDPRPAVLQRAVSNFVRKNYDGALAHFKRAAPLWAARPPDPLELRIAASLLSSAHGVEELWGERRDILEALARCGLPGSVRRAMAYPLRWRLRAALAVGDLSEALGLRRIAVGGLGVSLATLAMARRPQWPPASPST